MTIEVVAFSEHLTMNREDFLHPQELEEFSLAPGACTCTGNGSTSTSTVCCCCSGGSNVAGLSLE